MRFRVRYKKAALNMLAKEWLLASSTKRAAITRAMHLIDQELKSRGDQSGESRPNGRRVLIAAPVAVLYRLLQEKEEILVLRVWTFKQRQD